MSEEPDDLKAFTRALARVPPGPGRLDRDALLFAAGRAAGHRGRFWPATAAVLTALCAALTVALVTRPAVVERVVLVPIQVPSDVPGPDPVLPQQDIPTPMEAPSPALAAGLRLRQRLLRDGIPALPQPPWAPVSPLPSSDDVPDLYSLRLNASHQGERFR